MPRSIGYIDALARMRNDHMKTRSFEGAMNMMLREHFEDYEARQWKVAK